MIRRLLLATLVAGCLAGAARAEVILTGFGGVTFGGATEQSQGTYGGGIGFLGGGVFGFEAEFAITPDFFGDQTTSASFADNSVQVLNGNLLLAFPVSKLRVYGTAGAGVLRPHLKDRSGFFELDSDKAGYNVGGGLILSLSDHLALRGDIRYFRTFGDVELVGQAINFGKLDFWRGTGGLMFKF